MNMPGSSSPQGFSSSILRALFSEALPFLIPDWGHFGGFLGGWLLLTHWLFSISEHGIKLWLPRVGALDFTHLKFLHPRPGLQPVPATGFLGHL